MKSVNALTLLALLASTVSAQDTNGCDENYSGTFEIAPYNITANIPAQGPTICTTNPIVTLKNGVLTDQNDRTGEVVANHQFQFDNPVQGPTTSGFSVCSNGSLALNGNAVFYGCASGGFSNLYDISIGGQCYEIYIVTFPCSGGVSGIASAPASAPTTSSTSTTPVPTPVAPPTTSTSSTPVAPPVISTSSTPVAPPVTSTSSTPVVPPTTSTPVAPAPFPAGNSTTPAGSSSSLVTATSSPTTSSTSSTPTPATTFKGAASIVAVGGKVVAVLAGIAAFALF